MRARSVAAVIRGDAVLMVRHQHDGRAYWTLPGGGVEPGESLPEAAIRELHEETGLRGRIVRLLYEAEQEACYLVEAKPDQEPALGADPELGSREQMITAIEWRPLSALTDDIQVSKVIAAMKEGPAGAC